MSHRRSAVTRMEFDDEINENDVVVNPINTIRGIDPMKKRSPVEIQLEEDSEMENEEEQFQQEKVTKDSGIEIRKPNYQIREKGLLDWSPDILPKHFAMGVVGRPNAGKSHLIYEFLTNPKLYYQKFNRVLFITPCEKIGGIHLNQSPYWNRNFNLQWIKQQVELFSAEIRKKYPNDADVDKAYGQNVDPFNMLILMDDCVGEMRKYQFDEYFKSVVFNRRHLIPRGCVSLIFTTQYYVRIPRDIRANMNTMIIFNCTPEDWNRVQNETVYKTSQISSQTQKAVDEIFMKENAFVYINIDKGTMYCGFKEQIQGDIQVKEENKELTEAEQRRKKVKTD